MEDRDYFVVAPTEGEALAVAALSQAPRATADRGRAAAFPSRPEMNLVLEAPSDLPSVQRGVDLVLVEEAIVGFLGVDEVLAL
jgi:hypothetical protein